MTITMPEIKNEKLETYSFPKKKSNNNNFNDSSFEVYWFYQQINQWMKIKKDFSIFQDAKMFVLETIAEAGTANSWKIIRKSDGKIVYTLNFTFGGLDG